MRFGRPLFGRFGGVKMLSVLANIDIFDFGAFPNIALLSRLPEEAEK